MIQIKKNNITYLQLDTNSNDTPFLRIGSNPSDPTFTFPDEGGTLVTEENLASQLSDKVDKTATIAGNSLENNITTEALLTSLFVVTTENL